MTPTHHLLGWLGLAMGVDHLAITKLTPVPVTLVVALHMIIVTLIGAVAVSVSQRRATP